MLAASHPSIPARCARRPAPLGLPLSHRSSHPWQSLSLAPTPLESCGAGARGARALPGRPGRAAAAGPERGGGGGWGGDGPGRRGRAGGRGGGQEQ